MRASPIRRLYTHLTHIDLFSGIGGFALAARWSGFETIVFCEKDKYCRRVLRRHWPDVTTVEDIHEFDGAQYAGSTLLTGGPPCQPFSRAGKRRGSFDHRHLWPQMFRIISEARPSWIIAENVTGIISVELDRMLADLESQGYQTLTLNIPACAVDAPHQRQRIWIVANANSSGFKKQWWSRPAQEKYHSVECPCRWTAEPGVGRVAHGIPNRVDRIRGLGNAVVPQVAHQIIRHIAYLEMATLRK